MQNFYSKDKSAGNLLFTWHKLHSCSARKKAKILVLAHNNHSSSQFVLYTVMLSLSSLSGSWLIICKYVFPDYFTTALLTECFYVYMYRGRCVARPLTNLKKLWSWKEDRLSSLPWVKNEDEIIKKSQLLLLISSSP